jgi:hypothetical protein
MIVLFLSIIFPLMSAVDNNEKYSVSSMIKQVKGLQTARWLNHLYFIDGFGNEKSVKKYISKRYNLEFS